MEEENKVEEQNKKVTRRKFLENSSKKALAGTAAAFLGLGMIKPKTVEAAGCWLCVNTCSGGCRFGCESGCWTGCYTACTGGCKGSCVTTCHNDCSSVCGFDGSMYGTAKAADVSETCGTHVLEREASNRHVTA